VTIRVFNRRFHPSALALGMAAFSLGFTWILQDRWHDVIWDTVLGGFALVIGFVLAAGWGFNDVRWMRLGFLMSTGLWVFVAWAAAVGVGSWTSTLLALSWAALAGGSYALETYDPDARHEAKT
jgi:hypothetical protein